MRVPVNEGALPQKMAGAWRVNAHATKLVAHLDAAQLVAGVFGKRPKPLVQGEALRTQAGGFEVEYLDETAGVLRVVLLTDAPGLEARLGITAVATSGGSDVVLYTSVHPRSWVGRLYYRLIEPFHHLLMEHLLLRRLRRRASQLVRSRES